MIERHFRRSCLCFITGLLAFAISLSACGRQASTSENERFPIESTTARNLSDHVANDLIQDHRNILRNRMDNAFRETVAANDFDSIVDQMLQVYGKPIEFKFKQEESGSKLYANGTTKAVRKFWYAAKTTKYEQGSHFLIVEVVTDGAELTVSSFSIVNFPLGIPETLK